jgi:hypothetical protein
VGTQTKETGVNVQTWLPPELADRLKAQAEQERRSLSQTIRNTLEDALRGSRSADHERDPSPFPDPLEPDDWIAEVHDAIRKSPELDDDERQVAQAIADKALERGTVRAAELVKELEGADAREIVDEARQSLGMNTIAEQEANEKFERENANLPPGRDAEGRCFQGCAAENCHAYPRDEQGIPIPVADRIWWCDQHRDLAGEEDHLPPEVRYVWDMATISLRAVGAERERLLDEDRERERKAAERSEQGRREAEALTEVRERYEAEAEPMRIGGWLVGPGGKVIDEH